MGSAAVSVWSSTPLGRSQRIAVADALVGAVLGILGAVSALGLSGLSGSNTGSPHAGWPAAVVGLLMTAPVALARRYPVGVAVVLGVGAVVNGLVIGTLVRCGAALPAAFYAAFAIGWQCVAWWPVVIGTGALLVNLMCQSILDPRLGFGPSVLVYMALMLACVAGGVVLAGRHAVVVRLRERTEELREQREATARLAVQADRAHIADQLDGFLQDQVTRIGSVAAAGRAALVDRADDATRAFVTIQAAGRLTLGRMRDVVADLSDDGSPNRSRLLAGLDRLLADATEGRASLRVAGDPWLPPPGMELSGFRIVEQLLPCLQPTRPPGRGHRGLRSQRYRAQDRRTGEPAANRPTGGGGGAPPGGERGRHPAQQRQRRTADGVCHPSGGSGACLSSGSRACCGCRHCRRRSDCVDTDSMSWPASLSCPPLPWAWPRCRCPRPLCSRSVA